MVYYFFYLNEVRPAAVWLLSSGGIILNTIRALYILKYYIILYYNSNTVPSDPTYIIMYNVRACAWVLSAVELAVWSDACVFAPPFSVFFYYYHYYYYSYFSFIRGS